MTLRGWAVVQCRVRGSGHTAARVWTPATPRGTLSSLMVTASVWPCSHPLGGTIMFVEEGVMWCVNMGSDRVNTFVGINH